MTTQMVKLTTPPSSLKKVTKFFTRIYDSFVEARQLQAAMETAHYLKSNNTDYRHMSYGDIVNKIMSDINKKERE